MKSVTERLPVREEELTAMHKEAKESAMDHFESKSVGADAAEFLGQLKEKIATKIG
jgi:hypothetical protein